MPIKEGVTTQPSIIRKPKKVDPESQGPLLPPPAAESWQQPVWGSGCALYSGKGPWAATGSSQSAVLKPGKRPDVFGGQSVTEPTEPGSDYAALLKFVRACYRAGWYPWQCAHLLDLKRDVGPGAYFHWLTVRSSSDSDWFEMLWEEMASTESGWYWAKQDQGAKGNRTHPEEGPITFCSAEPSTTFVIHEKKLGELRRWVAARPGLSQTEIKTQAPLNGRVVVKYLEELERRGLASSERVKTGKGGMPRKVWAAVYTAEELAQFELERVVTEERLSLVDGLLHAEFVEKTSDRTRRPDSYAAHVLGPLLD